MKTLNEQYQLIKEGKGHKGVFLNEAKRQFPNYIRNAATFDETTTILKQKGIINENLVGLSPINKIESKEESFELAFKKFLEEAKDPQIKAKEVKAKKIDAQEEDEKAELKKTSKQVEEDLEKGYNQKDLKNIDNLMFDQVMRGYYAEMKDPKNADKTMQQLKDIVLKNLAKDPMHYVKDGQFGVKGLGYVTEHPGLGTPKEPTGKYKSSGYGDLKENIQRDSKGNMMFPPGSDQSKLNKLAIALKTKLTGSKYDHIKLDGYEIDLKDNKYRITNTSTGEVEATYPAGTYEENEAAYKAIINKFSPKASPEELKESAVRKIVRAIINEELETTKSTLTEGIEKDLAVINKEAEHEALQNKLDKVQALIDKKQTQLDRLDEDEDMKDLTDKKKVKEIEKDIKALEKAKSKIEKMMSKGKGKKKEVIEDGAEDPMDEAAGDLDPTNLAKSNAELAKIKTTLDTIGKTDVLEDEEESEY